MVNTSAETVSFAASIDSYMQKISDPIAGFIFKSIDVAPVLGIDEPVEILLILVWLMLASFFLTFYLGFINIRFFKHGIDLVTGKVDGGEKSEGQINRFQALMTTMSGTVGLGNIGGVAIAVSVGGPGAVLWMVLMGLFGMTTKFVEATLGIKYREHFDHEHPERLAGGPMYYLEKGFENIGLKTIGLILAYSFAVFCVLATLGAGPIYQTNQAFTQLTVMTDYMDDRPILFGTIVGLLVATVIIGGIKSIASVASKIVPIMGGVYVISGLMVIAYYYAEIPDAFGKIFSSALTLEAGIGGLLGAIIQGVRRAAFSNEAGIGSAAIGHSAVKVDQPVSQGFVAMLGPFIDTCIICLITGLVIVVSGVYNNEAGLQGVELTSQAFGSASPIFPYILLFTVQLFAFSTIITWSYYGLKCWSYIFGSNWLVENFYKLIVCLCVIVGAASELTNVINFTDAMVFAMAIPNIIALYLLAPEVKKDLKHYLENYKN